MRRQEAKSHSDSPQILILVGHGWCCFLPRCDSNNREAFRSNSIKKLKTSFPAFAKMYLEMVFLLKVLKYAV